MEHIGGLTHGEHDHLEGYDHREDQQVVDDGGEGILNARDVPAQHTGCQGNSDDGEDSDEERVSKGFEEAYFSCSFDVILPTGEGIGIRELEGLRGDEKLTLKGIHQNDENRCYEENCQKC